MMIENKENLLMKAKLNSIGKNKKSELKSSSKNISRKLLITLISTLLALSMCACSSKSIDTRILEIEYGTVDLYLASETIQFEKIIKENDMEFSRGNNELDEYMKIKEYMTEENMIIYYDIFGAEECNKIAQVFGYQNLDDFLIKNDYCDEKGNPSVYELRQQTYLKITNDCKENVK